MHDITIISRHVITITSLHVIAITLSERVTDMLLIILKYHHFLEFFVLVYRDLILLFLSEYLYMYYKVSIITTISNIICICSTRTCRQLSTLTPTVQHMYKIFVSVYAQKWLPQSPGMSPSYRI